MSDQFWWTDEQVERLRPHFPKAQGKPRVDDRRVLSGIIHVKRNGPSVAGCTAGLWTPQDPFQSFSALVAFGVFDRLFRCLARPGADGDTLMIDSTHPQGTPDSGEPQKGGRVGAHEGWPELQADMVSNGQAGR